MTVGRHRVGTFRSYLVLFIEEIALAYWQCDLEWRVFTSRSDDDGCGFSIHHVSCWDAHDLPQRIATYQAPLKFRSSTSMSQAGSSSRR